MAGCLSRGAITRTSSSSGEADMNAILPIYVARNEIDWPARSPLRMKAESGQRRSTSNTLALLGRGRLIRALEQDRGPYSASHHASVRGEPADAIVTHAPRTAVT
jgi:hypothetical protein